MVGNSLDALAISSYLDSNDLIDKIESSEKRPGTNVTTYVLKDRKGKISLSYDKHFDTLRVAISSEILEEISKELKKYGYQSREDDNLKK